MIWAEIAWGAYWSWDPKETVTLLIFIFVCMSVLLYEKRKKISLLLLVCCSLLIVANLMITFGSLSLHGYGL
jgi:ABC-type transport system involved in cytochrome c biogenesis permease subunit